MDHEKCVYLLTCFLLVGLVIYSHGWGVGRRRHEGSQDTGLVALSFPATKDCEDRLVTLAACHVAGESCCHVFTEANERGCFCHLTDLKVTGAVALTPADVSALAAACAVFRLNLPGSDTCPHVPSPQGQADVTIMLGYVTPKGPIYTSLAPLLNRITGGFTRTLSGGATREVTRTLTRGITQGVWSEVGISSLEMPVYEEPQKQVPRESLQSAAREFFLGYKPQSEANPVDVHGERVLPSRVALRNRGKQFETSGEQSMVLFGGPVRTTGLKAVGEANRRNEMTVGMDEAQDSAEAHGNWEGNNAPEWVPVAGIPVEGVPVERVSVEEVPTQNLGAAETSSVTFETPASSLGQEVAQKAKAHLLSAVAHQRKSDTSSRDVTSSERPGSDVGEFSGDVLPESDDVRVSSADSPGKRQALQRAEAWRDRPGGSNAIDSGCARWRNARTGTAQRIGLVVNFPAAEGGDKKLDAGLLTWRVPESETGCQRPASGAASDRNQKLADSEGNQGNAGREVLDGRASGRVTVGVTVANSGRERFDPELLGWDRWDTPGLQRADSGHSHHRNGLSMRVGNENLAEFPGAKRSADEKDGAHSVLRNSARKGSQDAPESVEMDRNENGNGKPADWAHNESVRQMVRLYRHTDAFLKGEVSDSDRDASPRVAVSGTAEGSVNIRRVELDGYPQVGQARSDGRDGEDGVGVTNGEERKERPFRPTGRSARLPWIAQVVSQSESSPGALFSNSKTDAFSVRLQKATPEPPPPQETSPPPPEPEPNPPPPDSPPPPPPSDPPPSPKLHPPLWRRHLPRQRTPPLHPPRILPPLLKNHHRRQKTSPLRPRKSPPLLQQKCPLPLPRPRPRQHRRLLPPDALKGFPQPG